MFIGRMLLMTPVSYLVRYIKCTVCECECDLFALNSH